MFSSNTLLQPVFGHQNDIYYTGSMMKLDLERYLWLELEEQYDQVYNMLCQKGDIIVRAVGRDDMEREGVKKKPFKTMKRSAAIWINDLLTEKNTHSALIISAADFCELFKNPDDCKELKDLVSGKDAQKRTGTIVMTFPAITEPAKKMLLTEPAFANLGDTGIMNLRSEREVSLFSELVSNKPDSCLFLNVYDKERVGNVVKHIVFDHPGRFVSRKAMEEQTDFLTHYLNDRLLYMKVNIIKDMKVFALHFFRVLYSELAKQDVWNRLCRETEICKKAGGYSKYLEQKGIPLSEEEQSRIFTARDPNFVAGFYMMLSTAGCKAAEGEYYESNVRMLNNICSLLVQPKNTEENELVTDCLKRLRSSLNNAVSEKDRNSYYRILRAAEFFTENLYLPDEPKKQELIAGFYAVLEQELNCAEAYTRACNDLRGVHNEHSITTLREKNRERTQKNLAEADSAVLYYMEYFRGLKGIDEKDMKALKDIYHSLRKQLGEDDQPINGVYTDDLAKDVPEDDDEDISGEWMYDGTRFF